MEIISENSNQNQKFQTENNQVQTQLINVEQPQKNVVTHQRSDSQMLMFLHLSQLLYFLTFFGGFIIPLIIWLSKKDEIKYMDEHGKDVMNFQISTLIYTLISVPLIFLFGLGILFLIIIGISMILYPIINGVRAINQQKVSYPLTIKFLK